MAAFIYFVLYEQITGLKASQTACIRDFRCQATPFKRLVIGKRQPGGPGRLGKKGKSTRTLSEVAAMEGGTPAKQPKRTTRTTSTAAKPQPKPGKGKGRGKNEEKQTISN